LDDLWHPLRAPSGEIVAINVAAEEITERKRAEQAIRDARDAAETVLRRRGAAVPATETCTGYFDLKDGGAGSLLRTGLGHNFPEIREFTGKNAGLVSVTGCPCRDSYGDSIIYPRIGMLT
jgi:hypothetical protein